MTTTDISINERLDHLGIVAGVCQENRPFKPLIETILPVVLGSVNTRGPNSMPLPDGWKRARPLVPRPPTLLCFIS
jgi:hypothetical protein